MRSKIDDRTKDVLRYIGAALREGRREAGMSQGQLASAISMDRENYAKIERAEINVTIDTLVRLAEGVGRTLSFTLVAHAPRRAGAAAGRKMPGQ